ncbi:MAG: hypothetical protein V7605_1874 [Acidimicrobiaceae bacterium]|jgi:hypothetical protein
MPSTAPTIDLPHAGKPVFRGAHGIVPYVAMWTAEEVLSAPVIETPVGIGYADETAVDRDAQGLLWTRTTVRQGVGKPIYDQLHPLRQRRAMRRMLCQVCAGPADQDERGALWLIQDQRSQWAGWPEGAQNAHPPLCLRCARISVKACPWLASGYVAVRAHSHVNGASGGLYRAGRPAPRLVDAVTVTYEDPRRRWTQADQLVRELVGCSLVEL